MIFFLSLVFVALAVGAEDKGLRSVPLPPAVVYHVGNRSVLAQNEAADTVPLPAWEQFVMGSGTYYGLVPYRRGLYGSSGLDSLELYASLRLRKGKTEAPWVMGVRIKEECRREGSVAAFFGEKYYQWIGANLNEILQGGQRCLQLRDGALGCDALVIPGQSIALGGAETSCDRALNLYLREANARIVVDESYSNSWYIRDRSCIEAIESSPAEVLELVSREMAWDMKSRQTTYSGLGGYGIASLAILVSALAESPVADPATLARIREKLAASDIRLSFYAEKPIGQFRWVSETGPALVDAYRRCVASGQMAEFQGWSQAFGQTLRSEVLTTDDGSIAQVQGWTSELKSLCH